MDYRKITFHLKPDNQDYRDILMATLADIGFESFVENEDNIEAYITDNNFDEEQLQSLDLKTMFEFSYKHEIVPDKNWNEEWEKNYFKPLIISNRCLIRAPFHKNYPKAEFEIVIEPKMAFGTGNHETTSLMIDYLLDNDLTGKTILDMGCGTGILSMLASMKKADKITAVDIDQWAFESTIENCKLNKCKNVVTFIGDASLIGDNKFDIILANIHKNILIEDMCLYNKALNDKGLLFMSGFYENDLNDIKECAFLTGLKFETSKSKNKWVAAAFKKE